jgi:hypothetical protein
VGLKSVCACCWQLGSWNVTEQKLLPLMLECRDDLELIVVLTKIFVMLTMPLSAAVMKRARLELEGPVDSLTRREALQRQSNARAQMANLTAIKRLFVRSEAIAVLVSTMEEPLSHAGGRSEEDNHVIELVLTLFRNLLRIESLPDADAYVTLALMCRPSGANLAVDAPSQACDSRDDVPG